MANKVNGKRKWRAVGWTFFWVILVILLAVIIGMVKEGETDNGYFIPFVVVEAGGFIVGLINNVLGDWIADWFERRYEKKNEAEEEKNFNK